MFENIGEKIKMLAKVGCVVNMVIFGVSAIILLGIAHNYYYITIYAILGFTFLILGPIIAWILSCLIYGFGELIETNRKIAENTRSYNQDSDINKDTSYDNEPETATESDSISREAPVSDLQFKI